MKDNTMSLPIKVTTNIDVIDLSKPHTMTPAYADARAIMLAQMVAAGKTDGLTATVADTESIDDASLTRLFDSRTSADEWISWVNENFPENFTLSHSITDIV